MSFCPRDFSLYSRPTDFIDFGSKFRCNSTCCSIIPTAPAYGLGVYNRLGGPPPCNGELIEEDFGYGYASLRRGPAGWTELGWVGSISYPVCHEKISKRHRENDCDSCNHKTCRAARGCKFSKEKISSANTWKPRKQFREEDFAHDYDEDYDCDCPKGYDGGGLQVQCRVRRYRLYARPFYGWCRGYDANQWQYAVVEEGVPRCDAIFIVLSDNPRFREGWGGGGSRYNRQQLESGELIRVPGEPGPFRVHLYADDDRY